MIPGKPLVLASCLVLLSSLFGAASVARAARAGDAVGVTESESIDPPDELLTWEFQGEVALVSDYLFRGMTMNRGRPSLQGGVSAETGPAYAGIWAGSADGDAQWTLLGGIALDAADWVAVDWAAVDWVAVDLGVVYYRYANLDEFNGEEIYTGLILSPFEELSLSLYRNFGLDELPDDNRAILDVRLGSFDLQLEAGDYEDYGRRGAIGLYREFLGVEFGIRYLEFRPHDFYIAYDYPEDQAWVFSIATEG